MRTTPQLFVAHLAGALETARAMIEALTIGLGTAVAKTVLKIWLKSDPVPLGMATDATDLIAKALPSVLERRRVARQFDQMAEQVADRLAAYFTNEFRGISENEKVAAADSVAKTLESASLTTSKLLQLDLDPEKVEQYMRSTSPRAEEKALLDSSGTALYAFTLKEVSNYIVELTLGLPDFSEKAARELLQRETALMDQVNKVLDSIPKYSRSKNDDEQAAQIQTQYLREVARKLDWLELFGLDVSQANRRYSLSVSYISLAVNDDSSQSRNYPTRGDNHYAYSDPWSHIAQTAPYVDPTDYNEGLPPPWHVAFPGREQDYFYSQRPAFLTMRAAGSPPSTPQYISAESALAGASYALIRGEAGSGKTTLLQWIAVMSARNALTWPLEEWNGLVPFFLRLRRYSSRPLPRPEEFLDEIAPNLAGWAPRTWVHTILGRGNGIVLIDGLDELPAERRQEVLEWLIDMVKTFPRAKYIVTSRPPAVTNAWLQLADFRTLDMLPMGTSQIKALIDHWHAAAGVEDVDATETSPNVRLASALKGQVRENPALRSLATSPLMCAMLCALNYERRSKLPAERIELYRTALEMFLDRRDSERNVVSDLKLSRIEQEQVLQSIAYWMLVNQFVDVDRASVVDRITNSLRQLPRVQASAQRVYDYLLLRSGLLREPAEGRVDFTHKTFLEYLAARECVQEDHIGLLLDTAGRDQWREVVILATGLGNRRQAERILVGLLDAAKKNPKASNSYRLLAAASLESSPRIDPEVAQTVASALEELVPPTDMEAARLLAASGDIVVPLLRGHSTRSEAQVAACIRALSLVGTDAAQAVIASYGKDGRPGVIDELVTAWTFFEPEDYAEAVLADSPLQAGTLVLSEPHLIPAARHLSHLKELILDLKQGRPGSVLKSGGPPLAHLILDGNDSLTDFAFAAGLACRAIRAVGCGRLSDLIGLRDVVGLQTVDLTDCQSIDSIRALRDVPELRRLTLTGCRRIKSLSPIGEVHSLESLDLRNIPYDPRYVQLDSVLRPLQNMRDLRLSESDGVKGLVDMKSLRFLQIQNFRAKTLIEVGTLGELTDLRLGGLERTKDLSPLNAIPSLECLELDGLTALQSLAALPRLKNLRILSLQNAAELEDASPVSSLPMLASLRLDGSSRLTDVDFLCDLVTLRELHLSHLPRLKSAQVLASMGSLRRLSVVDTGIADLSAIDGLATLVELNLSGGVGPTAFDVLHDLPSLETLTLGKVESVNMRFVRSLSNLRTIVVSAPKRYVEQLRALGLNVMPP